MHESRGYCREATVRPARAMAAVDYGHSGCPGGQPTGCVCGSDVFYVCPAGPPACDYGSIQDAVDAAADGDTIKVAEGTYTGVHERTTPASYEGPANLRQMVYLTKTVTIQGGYAMDDWTTPDLVAHPTVLDAQGLGRVVLIAGEHTPAIKSLRLTGGDTSIWVVRCRQTRAAASMSSLPRQQ